MSCYAAIVMAYALNLTSTYVCSRNGFAKHLLEDGYDRRTIQELSGYADVRTTMIYTRVLNKGGGGVTSPLEK